MEQTQAAREFETRVKTYFNRFYLVGTASCAMFVTVIATIHRWSTFNWDSKFEAIMLLLILASSLLLEILTGKKPLEGFARIRGVSIGYFMVVLAIMIFAQR